MRYDLNNFPMYLTNQLSLYFSAYKHLLIGTRGDINSDRFNVMLQDSTDIPDLNDVLKGHVDGKNVKDCLIIFIVLSSSMIQGGGGAAKF